MKFDDSTLFADLESADQTAIDALDFGIIALRADGTVDAYNRYESELSGLTRERVVGNHFFTAVAPCTNNFMVAQRFMDEESLDAVIDYVFTLKMRPTKVKLRLLKSPTGKRQYIVVRRA